MSPVRRQLPVHSPTSFRSVQQGLLGALGIGATDSASLVQEHWPAEKVIFTNSGTSALTLAIQAAARHTGVVALPAWGCYDLATAADGAGLRVALYDVDPDQLAPDPRSLEHAFALGAGAVVVVPFYGVPIDMDKVRNQARSAGVRVIEDAAQAIGASWKGTPAGSHGDFGILSFGRGKGLNAGGGGALLANTTEAHALLTQLDELSGRAAGWDCVMRATAQWMLARPSLYAVPAALPFLRLGETVYHPPSPVKALSRASVRMLQANWKRAQAATGTRKRIAQRLLAVTAEGNGRPVRIPEGGEAGYLRFPLVTAQDVDAATLARAGNLGIMRGYPRTLASLAGFERRCINATDAFPGADALARRLITLPTHELLTEADLRRLEHWLTHH